MASPRSGDPSLAGLPPRPVATPGETRGPAATPQPPFLDIYCGDAQLWEEHFRGIGRAYCALGKEDDFAIRVLTEDFTLPFPFAWPPGPDPARGPLFYDPHDRTGFDFLLRGPDAPPPALLRPLHNTAQAAVRRRRLEQLALSTCTRGAAPGPASRGSCPRPPPAAPSRGPWGLRRPPPAGAPPGWVSAAPKKMNKECLCFSRPEALCRTHPDGHLVPARPPGPPGGVQTASAVVREVHFVPRG
ncbi:LOW QUALITY PROTEIN: uncharacterized protein C8orf90 homolog [Eschrichtius robustus]|uniref:LOW QUALITY PROTEIN: uncharacterized protein C8orf90 homolog n=1 Tax=Eschrichtius robustus TaxID=9764 RepID=UPI0035C1957C